MVRSCCVIPAAVVAVGVSAAPQAPTKYLSSVRAGPEIFPARTPALFVKID
jgi:hypothetical protein